MAVQYMAVCIIDFVIFPIMWTGYQAYSNVPLTQWDPLTLKATGLYHLAMGAVCGVAAYTRGRENIYNAQNASKYSGYDYPPPRAYNTQPTGDEYDVPRGTSYP